MERIQEKEPPEVITSDTENATTIPVDEAPPAKREKFRKFRAYNTGLWNGPRRENKTAIMRQDNLHLYDAIASQIELTDYQQKRGRVALDRIELNDFGGPNLTVDLVIWSICVIVANDDVPEGTRYWPHPQTKSNDGLIEQVANDLGMDLSKQMSVLQRVMARTDI